MRSELMSDYSQVMAYLATAGFLASVLAMGFLAPWYRSWTGWVLLLVKLTTFLVLLLVALRLTFGNYPYIETVRAVIYTGAMLSGWGVTGVIIRAQVLGKKNRLNNMLERRLWTKDESATSVDELPAPIEWDGVERRKKDVPPTSDRPPTE